MKISWISAFESSAAIHFGMYSLRYANSPGWWPVRLSIMKSASGMVEMSRIVTPPLA
jgi:hypothetical protein